MPKKIVIEGVAKIFLVHDKNLSETITFTGFHRPEPPLLSARGTSSTQSYAVR
jgi:hypothetical protein